MKSLAYAQLYMANISLLKVDFYQKHFFKLGKAERKALTKANIKWQPGNTWGEDDNWARLSLGQTREIVRAAVRATLK